MLGTRGNATNPFVHALSIWGWTVDLGPSIPTNEPVALGLCASYGNTETVALAALDGDGLTGFDDNCPQVANPDQRDSGGVATNTPDGIGDACQCGDVTGNGIVNGQDANAIKRRGLGGPNPTLVVPGNCDVTGNGSCNGQDANAVKRRSATRARSSGSAATTQSVRRCRPICRVGKRPRSPTLRLAEAPAGHRRYPAQTLGTHAAENQGGR